MADKTGDYYFNGVADEIPEHQATLSAFSLDKYEVTVGRFRKFVNNYEQWHVVAKNPESGVGQFNSNSATGWNSDWLSTDGFPADTAALKSTLACTNATWSAEPGDNETAPINCVSWYEAFMFCHWDGGRLPTEAEWEYATAGGAENRLYAWGSAPPDEKYANYTDFDNNPFLPVGSKGAAGGGYFGHRDLSGSVWEWVFDTYSSTYYTATQTNCNDCISTATANTRGARGGAWDTDAGTLRGARRGNFWPQSRGGGMGLRCARAAY
jgi:formylglycine-generating enzyme required for sulfatase activity